MDRVALHDGWAPYRDYAGATHALCNAHHLRELDALAAEAGQGWVGAMAEWLSMAKTHTERTKAAGASGLAPDDLSGWLAAISGCWRTMTAAEAFCGLRSYIASARKHGHNPLTILQQLFNGHP